jgi:hypothetical protein
MKASSYSLRFARRNSAPKINITLPHDRSGQAIGSSLFTDGTIGNRLIAGFKNFSRLRRADEL